MYESKPCSRCKQIKPLTEYGNKSNAKDGKATQCLICCREIDKARHESRKEAKAIYSATWRSENQNHIKEYRQTYYELNAEKLKQQAMDWYWLNLEQARATRKKYAIENAEYLNAIAAAWAKANPEKKAAHARLYKSNHPEKAREYEARRRALMYENGIFFIFPKEIAKLYNSPCFYCGSKEKIEADHVLAIKRTGCHGISNLVPACRSCNGSKGEKTIMEWRLWKAKREGI